jgi:ribosomal protein S1
LDLVESQKSRKILTGTIQGVERSADNPNMSFAVIYRGEFKVIIPAEETVPQPDNLRGRSPGDVMNYLVTKRLGAEVDYIVKGMDVNSGIAAASRLEAMALKRRQYYSGTDRDGNNVIYEGLSAEARIVSVIRAGMFVDLFGLETYIPLRELSYQRWNDAAAHFQPGQRVLVKILKIDRSERDNIQVSASVKQAGENPYEQALKRYTPGSRYIGTVSLVDTSGVFVSLDGGIDCLCSYPNRGRPPRGSRVTVVIIGVNHDTNRIWGAITHMSTAR